MKKQFLLLVKNISLLLLLFTFSSIPIQLFGINVENFTITQKLIYLFVMDLIFLAIVFVAYRKTIIADFIKFKNKALDYLEMGFKYWIIGFIIMAISNIIIAYFTPSGLAQNEEAIRSLIDKAPIYMLFSIIIYAPFTEELIFRKGFKDLFSNKYLYIFLSGFTFGALHVISSITSFWDLLHLIPYCALGFTFAYTYHKSDNIFASISMHLMHNSLAIIIYFIGIMVK